MREQLKLFDKEGVTLTRFFPTLDADREMTRDPIFSFSGSARRVTGPHG